eukprot:TRINITY_DN12744_c0_g2_i3.p1 TRINITY_DN12744_c0_g2~~TRINITY_DN12744_c0_g2_i3.p1  ORF type:complete len:235 (+),score=52.16 TRINITY_DN12744_c0_g2_i3:79-783(+)
MWRQDESSNANATKQCKWRLVICLERIFKKEFTETVKLLKTYAHDNHATLICVKSHQNFEMWLRSNTKPYVLITGWREAKPSSNDCLCTPPKAFFVLADQYASIGRASAWTAENNATLLRSLDGITDQLSEAMESYISSEAARSTSCSYQGAMTTAAKDARMLSHGLQACENEMSGLKQLPSPIDVYVKDAGWAPDRIVSSRKGDFDLVKELASRYGKELESMLLEAMPAYYED